MENRKTSVFYDVFGTYLFFLVLFGRVECIICVTNHRTFVHLRKIFYWISLFNEMFLINDLSVHWFVFCEAYVPNHQPG